MRSRKFLMGLVIICTTLVILFSIWKMLNPSLNSFQLSSAFLTEKIEQVEKQIGEQTKGYVVDDPIQIGLYIEEDGMKKLVKEHICSFNMEDVMGLFYALPTNEEVVSNESFPTVWNHYWEKYENREDYKVGYQIQFMMNSGEFIEQTILDPDDAYLMFPKVQFYLYDDVNLIPGKRYYHILQHEMNEKTKCSSAKLVGDKLTKNISSPILLTVFFYRTAEDFEPTTGRYRGKSFYTIQLKQEK